MVNRRRYTNYVQIGWADVILLFVPYIWLLILPPSQQNIYVRSLNGLAIVIFFSF